jgi:hypothetical protein
MEKYCTVARKTHMTINILDEAKTRLQHDFISPTAEWAYLTSLIEKAESQRLELLKWVFEESLAYWDTRARAGVVLLQEDNVNTWQIVRNLVDSDDPDDNGTALTLFEITADPRAAELAQKWLNDGVHPVTQLEAINFLKAIYPDKVQLRVQALVNHDNPDIRRAAKKLSDELNAT